MLLENAGIPIHVHPHTLDERAEEKTLPNATPGEIALILAERKALSVSQSLGIPETYILGADQTLSCEGRSICKAENYEEAREILHFLSGKTHTLHTAIALVHLGEILTSFVHESYLTMRPLSDDFIESYLHMIGERAYQCVGIYPLESLGTHVFSRMEGDYFTILGIPLLSLFQVLREEGCLAS
jgi:septum formation protein